jgi:hypothetical protein
VLVLWVSLLSCNAPGRETVVPTSVPARATATPARAQQITPVASPNHAPDVIYEGISFSYDGALASHVEASRIPATGTTDGLEWELAPAHVQFTFAGYVLPDRFHKARILVYPVSEYEAISETAAAVIADLRMLLVERPAAPDTVPFLPTWNAAQLIAAKIAYVDFQNGSGVRFLSQYGQAANPINNYELFYTFQGVTVDGAHYVTAILPVSSPLLPADGGTIPGRGDYDAFVERYAAYLDDVKAQLDSQSPSDFHPDLELLDQAIASLRVT